MALCCSPSCAVLFDFMSCCGVRLVLLKNNFGQSQIQSMNWASILQIHKHEYSGDLNFIILGI